MYVIRGVERNYDWGSTTAIPEFMGEDPTGAPVAEVWYGAHPLGPAPIDGEGTLQDLIARDPSGVLGEDVSGRFGGQLPFLLKVIAPARALSLQVHPDLERAGSRFADEEAAGLPLDSPLRNYKDPNHKPEMVYALTTFQAMCGFRAPRRAAELMRGLDTDLTDQLHRQLRSHPNADGVREAFAWLLALATRPSAEQVAEVAEACRRRLETGSPSRRVDRTVVQLQEQHPGDPGVVASMLLNPVTLEPGQVLFVPAGAVHAYLSGLGVEIMASSDNVLRAGLTAKPIDVPEMLACVDYVAAPPIRIAPERVGPATEVYHAPVDDFELGTTVVRPDPIPVPGRAARTILCVEGEVSISVGDQTEILTPGRAVFVGAREDQPQVSGQGRIVQADVP